MESAGGQANRPSRNEAPPFQSVPPGRAALARVPPQTRVRGLRKSDLESKLLITQRSGRKFGAVSEAWVDPRRLQVAAFDVAQSSWAPSLVGFPSETICGGVWVKNLREVGDVVLIAGDQDFCPEMQMNRQGLTVLSGLEVRSETGELIGKIRDFVFDPNTGRITKLIFDRLGLPFLKVGLIDEFIIDVREVVRIVIPEGTIYVRSPLQYSQMSTGKYNFLANLGGVLQMLGNDQSEDTPGQDRAPENDAVMLEDQYQKILEESQRQQAAYYAMYGSQVPGLASNRGISSETGRKAPPKPKSMRGGRNSSPEYMKTPQAFPRRTRASVSRPRESGQQERATQINDWLIKDSRIPQFDELPLEEGGNAPSQNWREKGKREY